MTARWSPVQRLQRSSTETVILCLPGLGNSCLSENLACGVQPNAFRCLRGYTMSFSIALSCARRVFASCL